MIVDPINKFVFGIKGLELWNNMACWILRADQNKDIGTIVYSLGGLSAINMPHATLKTAGTPPGVPIWSTNGVVFSGDSDGWPQNYMESSSFVFNITPGITLFSVIYHDYAGLNLNKTAVDPTIMGILPTRRADAYQFPRRIELKRDSPTPANTNPSAYQSKYGIVLARNGYGETGFGNGPSANDDNNSWAVAGMSYLSGSQLFSRNGGNFVNGNLLPKLPTMSPGGPLFDDAAIGYPIENYRLITGTVLRNGRDGFRGVGAAYFYFNKFLDQREHAKLYTLYKETLGDGLGLP